MPTLKIFLRSDSCHTTSKPKVISFMDFQISLTLFCVSEIISAALTADEFVNSLRH